MQQAASNTCEAYRPGTGTAAAYKQKKDNNFNNTKKHGVGLHSGTYITDNEKT
jgi:hypothetical protein